MASNRPVLLNHEVLNSFAQEALGAVCSFVQAETPYFDGEFHEDAQPYHVWHFMWASSSLVVCQVSRRFQSNPDALKWARRWVDHNAERLMSRSLNKAAPENELEAFQMRPMSVHERLWKIGQNFHVFNNKEVGNDLLLPVAEVVLRVVLKAAAANNEGVRALENTVTLNGFFVSGNFLHKIFIQSLSEFRPIPQLMRLLQLSCLHVSSDVKPRPQILTLAPNAAGPIVLYDSLSRPWAQLKGRLLQISLQLTEAGKDGVALCSAVHDFRPALDSLLNKLDVWEKNPSTVEDVSKCPKEWLDLLHLMLKWPREHLYPGLDLVALLVLHRTGAKLSLSGNLLLQAVGALNQDALDDAVALKNASLFCRLVCNCFRWGSATTAATRKVVPVATLLESFVRRFTDAALLTAVTAACVGYANSLTQSLREQEGRVIIFRVAQQALCKAIPGQPASLAAVVNALRALSMMVFDSDVDENMKLADETVVALQKLGEENANLKHLVTSVLSKQ